MLPTSHRLRLRHASCVTLLVFVNALYSDCTPSDLLSQSQRLYGSTARAHGFCVAVCAVCFLMQLTAYGKLDAGEEAMKQEIHARGPIVCGIACPEEFIYKYHSAKNGGELSCPHTMLCHAVLCCVQLSTASSPTSTAQSRTELTADAFTFCRAMLCCVFCMLLCKYHPAKSTKVTLAQLPPALARPRLIQSQARRVARPVLTELPPHHFMLRSAAAAAHF